MALIDTDQTILLPVHQLCVEAKFLLEFVFYIRYKYRYSLLLSFSYIIPSSERFESSVINLVVDCNAVATFFFRRVEVQAIRMGGGWWAKAIENKEMVLH